MIGVVPGVLPDVGDIRVPKGSGTRRQREREQERRKAAAIIFMANLYG